jgi:hypothetical protein
MYSPLADAVVTGLLWTLVPPFPISFIQIPVNAIMIRVLASLLPDDIDTLVPLDRSFGGRVVATDAGGTGRLGLIAAWLTFSWRARFRLVGTVLASYAMFYMALMPAAYVFYLMLSSWRF